MPFLKSLQKLTKYNLGNQDRKKISKSANHEFKTAKNLEIVKTRERYTIVLDDGNPILFSVDDKNFLYTLKSLNENIVGKDAIKKFVKLDEGAYKPILNGANIMAQGIYKYKNDINAYNKGDYVYVLINDEFIAVGLALLSFDEIDSSVKGPAVEIVHCLNDALYSFTQ